ncbi:hypothetical protein KR093_001103, partial [Drosophila rubida]
WYRGLSDVQMEALKTLQVNLNDDHLQGTGYRVHYVLGRLGLHPVPPKCGIRKLIEMSRANEMAFLWFLMETYYISENHDEIYGSNEQLIMSSIFWLDFYPTLYALDHVLPLPHASAETRRKEAQATAKRNKLAERIKLKQNRAKLKPKDSSYAASPYFVEPVKMKYRRNNLLAFEPKVLALSMPVLKHEATTVLQSRWFGAMQVADGKLVADPLLRDEVNRIVSALPETSYHDPDGEIMCVHHKKIQELEKSLRENLEKIKKQKLDQLMDVNYNAKQRSRQRTLEQLNRLTEYYRAQFHNLTIKPEVTSTCKRLCAKANPDFIFADRVCNELDKETVLILSGVDPLPPICPDTPPKDECLNLFVKPLKHTCTVNQIQNSDPPDCRPEPMKGKDLLPSLSQFNNLEEYQKYFNKIGNNYNFNFQKLFEPNMSVKMDPEQMWIKKLFMKALGDDADYMNAVLDGKKSGSMTELVDRSAKRMFNKGIELFQQEYDNLVAQRAKESNQRLNFGQKYYDAYNTEQMKTMLKLGLERIAQDRRMVAPTLPNVHSVPLLIEWICARYGKLYSEADRRRNYKNLNKLMAHLNILLRKELVRRECHRPIYPLDKLLVIKEQIKKSRLLKQYWVRFMKYFVVSIMEVGRLFHTNSRIDSGSSSKSIYYAYMPSHIRDVHFSRIMPS